MQREGWQLVDRLYDDLGQSSQTLDRPALNRLVEDIRSGDIDRVLVHRLDRVVRKILYSSTSKPVKWLIRFAPLWMQCASTPAFVATGTKSGRN